MAIWLILGTIPSFLQMIGGVLLLVGGGLIIFSGRSLDIEVSYIRKDLNSIAY